MFEKLASKLPPVPIVSALTGFRRRAACFEPYCYRFRRFVAGKIAKAASYDRHGVRVPTGLKDIKRVCLISH